MKEEREGNSFTDRELLQSEKAVTTGANDEEYAAVDFDEELVKEGITDRYEAKKYRSVLEAKKPVITTDKEFYEGKLQSSTQSVIMVEDYTVQLQALKLLSTMRGRFEQKKKTLDARRVFNKIFVIGGKPEQLNPLSETHELPTIEEISIPAFSSNTQEEETRYEKSDSVGWTL